MLTRTPVSAAVLAAILSISINSQALAVEVDGSDTNLNAQYPNGVIQESETGISASKAKVEFTLGDIKISAGKTGVETGMYGNIILGNESANRIDIEISSNGSGNTYGIYMGNANTIGWVTALADKISITLDSAANTSSGIQNNGGELRLGNGKTSEVIIENKSRGRNNTKAIFNSGITLIEGGVISLKAINETSGSVYAIENNTGKLELLGSTITASAKGVKEVRGIYSTTKSNTEGETILGNGNSTINITAESSGGKTYGVYSACTSAVCGTSLKLNGSVVDITAKGAAEVRGIFSNGQDETSLGNDENSAITISAESSGGKAYGIYGSGSASAQNLLSGSNGMISINATGTQSHGMYVNAGTANIVGGSFEIESQSLTQGEDDYAYGLYGVGSNVVVDATNTHVVANARETAFAVLEQSGAKLTLGKENAGEVNLSATSENGIAIAIQNSSTTGEVSQTTLHGKDIKFFAQGASKARAVDSSTGSETRIGDTDSRITITSSAQVEAIGINSLNTGKTIVNGSDLSITVTSGETGNATGLLVQNSTLDADGDVATLEVNTGNTTINAKTGMTAMSQGVLKVTGNLYVDSEQALTTRGNAVVRINESNDKTVQLNGDVVFDFDKPTSNTGVDADVLINLSGANSYWNGNTIIAWNGTPDEDSKLVVNQMTLGLSDDATWTPTAVTDSAITDEKGQKYVALNQLNMQNGIVNVTDAEVNVTVERMTGSGTVNLATDLEAQTATGSFLVESAAEGAKIDVNLMNKDMTAELTSDEVDAAKATELLANVGGQDVQTSTTVKEGMVQPGFEVDADGNSRLSGPNSLMQSTLELASATPLAINRILMNDVRKRLGDIRSDANTHGAWARYDGGRLSGSNGLENDFNTIQVGIDTKPEGTSTRLGVAFSYTNGDADYARGSADMDAYSLAAYGTWIGEQGGFVDVVGRFAKVDSDMTVDGNKDASVDNLALSLSAEAGWRFNITDTAYFEPQVEMTYTYVDSENVQIGNAQYKINSVDSLLGRLGFAAGLNCPNNFGNVYVKASVVHEFLGDNKIVGATNGRTGTYEIDGKDTWFEYGLGANFNVSDSTYVWADVERTSGGVLDEDWRATVGVRYSW